MQTMYAQKICTAAGKLSGKEEKGGACIELVEGETGWMDVAGYVCVCRCV